MKRRVHQHGLSLIELLVSITIGLVILLAIGLVFLNGSQSEKQREDQTELNEPARVGLGLMRTLISQAGFVDLMDVDATARTQAAQLFSPGNSGLNNVYIRQPGSAPLSAPLTLLFPGLLPVYGCDGAMLSTPSALATTATPPALVLGCGAASALQQTLQLAQQVVPRSATPELTVSLLPDSATTGNGRDCLQQQLPSGAGPGSRIVINRLFISNTDGVNELHCAGSGNAVSQPLVRGVEELVFRYQMPVQTPGSTEVAGAAQARYVSASAVSADPIGWANVTAVEICLVSATANLGGNAAQGTALLQPTRPTCARDPTSGAFAANVARAAGDTRLWRRFTSVVAVRNALYASPN